MVFINTTFIWSKLTPHGLDILDSIIRQFCLCSVVNTTVCRYIITIVCAGISTENRSDHCKLFSRQSNSNKSMHTNLINSLNQICSSAARLRSVQLHGVTRIEWIIEVDSKISFRLPCLIYLGRHSQADVCSSFEFNFRRSVTCTFISNHYFSREKNFIRA